jgi:hypothetical protein
MDGFGFVAAPTMEVTGLHQTRTNLRALAAIGTSTVV